MSERSGVDFNERFGELLEQHGNLTFGASVGNPEARRVGELRLKEKRIEMVHCLADGMIATTTSIGAINLLESVTRTLYSSRSGMGQWGVGSHLELIQEVAVELAMRARTLTKAE